MEKGGEMDNSPVSAYVHHVIAIVIQSPPFPFYQVCPRDKFDPFAPSCVQMKHYSKRWGRGTGEAAMKKFTTLNAWQAGGRTGLFVAPGGTCV